MMQPGTRNLERGRREGARTRESFESAERREEEEKKNGRKVKEKQKAQEGEEEEEKRGKNTRITVARNKNEMT